MEQNEDFVKRYHPAVLLLMWKSPNDRLELDGTERTYDAFHEVARPLLRRFDYEPQPAGKGKEARWHIGLRLALLHMREDKHPVDGRVRRVGRGIYEITDRGRAWLSSYLDSSDAPLQWLDLEIEDSDSGETASHYRNPMTGGDVLIAFGSVGPTAFDDDWL